MFDHKFVYFLMVEFFRWTQFSVLIGFPVAFCGSPGCRWVVKTSLHDRSSRGEQQSGFSVVIDFL